MFPVLDGFSHNKVQFQILVPHNSKPSFLTHEHLWLGVKSESSQPHFAVHSGTQVQEAATSGVCCSHTRAEVHKHM